MNESVGLYVTWQTLLTGVAVLTALYTLINYFVKGYKWIDRQNKQEKEIKDMKEEQELLTYGVLACLKGLKEQGCDGAVTDAINKMEKHLNEKAHS